MSIYQSVQLQLRRQCHRGALGVSNSRLMSRSIFGFGSSSDDNTRSSSTSTPKIKPMSKRDIIEEVASTHDLTVAKSERIVNTVFDTIVEAVVDGKQVRLSSFGSFDCYMSKPRSGRNPNSGEAIEIESKRRIRFKAYDAFKKA